MKGCTNNAASMRANRLSPELNRSLWRTKERQNVRSQRHPGQIRWPHGAIFLHDRNRITSPAMNLQTQRRDWSWWYLLFVVEWAAVLWPPLYNKLDPQWHG